jgi:hypothetical protein
VISFTLRLLYPRGKSPRYPLDRRLDGPQSRSGRGGEKKNFQPPPGIEPPNLDRPFRSQSLYRLSYRSLFFIVCKGKGVPVLNYAPRYEGVLGEWMYSSTHSLTSALGGGEWSASRPGRFAPRERAPGTHWIGGWVGPRAVLDAVVKRKIPSPRWESNPRTPIV